MFLVTLIDYAILVPTVQLMDISSKWINDLDVEARKGRGKDCNRTVLKLNGDAYNHLK